MPRVILRDRARRYAPAEFRELAGGPILAPRAVLSPHTTNQCPQLGVDRRGDERRSTMSWRRSMRFSAATTARGAKNLKTAASAFAKQVEHRAMLNPLVSQVQPRRARGPSGLRTEFLRRTARKRRACTVWFRYLSDLSRKENASCESHPREPARSPPSSCGLFHADALRHNKPSGRQR